MAFRDVSSGAMLTISDRWRDPERDRPVLESLPVASGVVHLIDDAHQHLLERQGIGSVLTGRIRRVQGRQETSDGRHDSKKRGSYLLLTGCAELCDDDNEAAKYLNLRDVLMPGGRQETQRSYLDQIGDAKRLRARLQPEHYQLLATIRTPNGTLADEVESWIAAADELEELVEERIKLEQMIEASHATPADERDARNNWIRVARLLEANIALDPAVTEDIKDRILGPLYRAEAQAMRRRSSSAPVPEHEVDTDESTSTATPPSAG